MTRDFMQMQNKYKENVYGNLSGIKYLLKNPSGFPIFVSELESLISRTMEKRIIKTFEKDVDWIYEKRMLLK
jgi:hypothetical protein